MPIDRTDRFRNDQSPALRSRYAQLVRRLSPRSPLAVHCLRAFWVGGAICVLGEGIRLAAERLLHMPGDQASAFTSMALIFLSALTTGLGLYDRLGIYAGAGSAVPITGFANSVVSPAMEFRAEGMVMGTGARIFSIAGPVLVHGLLTAVGITALRLALGVL